MRPARNVQGRWDQSGVARGGGPVWIRWKDPALSDLAAGHLQGPARTRATYTDHLLSLVAGKIAARADVPKRVSAPPTTAGARRRPLVRISPSGALSRCPRRG